MRPYIRAANVTWHGLDLADVKEMNFDPEEAGVFELRDGDIVLNESSGSSNEVGKPAMWRGEIEGCCFQNTLLRVRAREVSTEYLFWYFRLLAVTGWFGERARGVNIKHLGKQGLESTVVPLAPADQRDAIVSEIRAAVDAMDAARSSIEAIESKASALKRSAIADAFNPGHGAA